MKTSEAVKTTRAGRARKCSEFSVAEFRPMLDVASYMPMEEATSGCRGYTAGEGILSVTWDSLNMCSSMYTVDWKLQTATRPTGAASLPAGRVRAAGAIRSVLWRNIGDPRRLRHASSVQC